MLINAVHCGRKGAPGADGEANPHLLVMSATPIPRTLALSLYGDLDLSILDEMPPGRQEIKTRWLRSSERERAYSFIRRQVAEGRQAYLIFPLVEESDKIEAKAAVKEYKSLQKEVFPRFETGVGSRPFKGGRERGRNARLLRREKPIFWSPHQSLKLV